MASQTKFCTYNLHGFKQGEHCLAELCSSADIIFIQEHWLHQNDFNKFDVFQNFTLFASSALNDAYSRGFMIGRPFGGIAIMIRNSIVCAAKLVV
jgi:exonuclease III